MVWGAIGAAAGLLAMKAGGSMASGLLSYSAQKKLIDHQQQWQERMSNTAHQREVADLRAAGLNPVLSATGGSGASFGSASAPGISIDSGIDPATAIQYKDYKLREKLNDAQTWNLGKQSSLLGEQARNEAERYQSIVQDRNNAKRLTDAQVRNYDANSAAALQNASTNAAIGASQVKLNNLNSARQSYDNEQARRRAEWIRNNPGQAKWTQGIGEWTGAIGNVFSGSAHYSPGKK